MRKQAGSIKLAAAFLRQTSVVGTNIWRGVMARRWRGARVRLAIALHRIEVKVVFWLTFRIAAESSWQ